MGKIAEAAAWVADVYQIETSDPVLGGPGGIANLAAEALANRTAYLKKQVEATASGTVKGMVKLSSSTNSNSVAEAATPRAVKAAYDLAVSAGSYENNFNNNGYTKLPNGLIIQWGGEVIKDAQPTAEYQKNGSIFNFPTPFPNKCFRMVISDVGGAVGSAAAIPIDGRTYRAWSKRVDDSNPLAYANHGFHYIAVGF